MANAGLNKAQAFSRHKSSRITKGRKKKVRFLSIEEVGRAECEKEKKTEKGAIKRNVRLIKDIKPSNFIEFFFCGRVCLKTKKKKNKIKNIKKEHVPSCKRDYKLEKKKKRSSRNY